MAKPRPAPPKIDEPRFVAMLTDRFPEVASRISDIAEGLVHLEVAVFRRATNEAIAAGDVDTVRRHYLFMDEVLRAADDDVWNAVAVSYLEDLDFRGPSGAAARKLLTPALRNELAAVEAHWERLFGKPQKPKRKPRRARGPR